MTEVKCVVAAAILISGSLVGAPVARPIGASTTVQPVEMGYEELMAQDPKVRAELFCSMSARNQASVMTTHITRWRERNANRLTELQRTLVSEWLSLVTPAMFTEPRRLDLIRRRDELDARSVAVFSAQDLIDALTVEGSYIPPR
jgi:hypothetical protein